MTKHYDIIINGGGIVGFTLMNLISKSSHLKSARVLLIEQTAKPANIVYNKPRYCQQISELNHTIKSQPEFSNRVSSITPQSHKTLHQIGAWDAIEPFTKKVDQIEVWNYDVSKRLKFSAKSTQTDELFTVVENNRLVSSLWESISSEFKKKVLWEHCLNDVCEPNDGSQSIGIRLVDKKEQNVSDFTCSILVGCDGFQSKVRQLSKITYNEINLGKSAVVGTVRLTYPYDCDNNVAYQRFSDSQDVVTALLPLDRNHSSFVISCPNVFSDHLLKCDGQVFAKEVNELLQVPSNPSNQILQSLHDAIDLSLNRIGFKMNEAGVHKKCDEIPKIECIVGTRSAYPISFGTTSPRMTASMFGRDNRQVVLLGDATHRVHPLAGQGLNLGIQDAKIFVDEIEGLMKRGENPFSSENRFMLDRALSKLELKRQSYVIPMSVGILLMPHLFRALPASVLSMLDRFNLIKNESMRYASGFKEF